MPLGQRVGLDLFRRRRPFVVPQVQASLSNRTFLVTDFPVRLGPNTLTVVATDTAGNVSEPVEIQVSRLRLVGQNLRVVAGNNQTGVILEPLPDRVIVQAVDAAGEALPGRAVKFRIERENPGIVAVLSRVFLPARAGAGAATRRVRRAITTGLAYL